ncbi:exported hypothetical protein [Candidatus Propionivibrio aalborgensis]|uniref:Uncharacterized protein n=1 Tax=Candidatus Propionivibrio aalborgensis TaxID=1860101 RepID=A0A1A8XXA5_9RHOO|nr:exported hypothetical protein [Candidatus Propionivibrio aalborgensis]
MSFSSYSFLIRLTVICFGLTTMFSFDAHAFGLLIALAMATAAFVISLGAVPVVRAIRVVRVVPNAPSRAGRR